MRCAAVLASVVSAGILAAPGAAWACALPVLAPHVVDATMQETDRVAPTLPRNLGYLHTRGKLSMDHGCLAPPPDHSCDNFDMLEIAAGAKDDMTPQDRIGYRLTLEAGMLLTGLTLPAEAVEPDETHNLRMAWVAKPGEVTDFTLRVVAIDRAGNESAPMTIRIRDQDIGCGAVRAGAPRPDLVGTALLALLVLLAAARRPAGPAITRAARPTTASLAV